MSDFKEFQNDVRDLIGGEQNFSIDKPHGNKPEHIDLTTKFNTETNIIGADKVEIDFGGNIIGGSTQINKIKLPW